MINAPYTIFLFMIFSSVWVWWPRLFLYLVSSEIYRNSEGGEGGILFSLILSQFHHFENLFVFLHTPDVLCEKQILNTMSTEISRLWELVWVQTNLGAPGPTDSWMAMTIFAVFSMVCQEWHVCPSQLPCFHGICQLLCQIWAGMIFIQGMGFEFSTLDSWSNSCILVQLSLLRVSLCAFDSLYFINVWKNLGAQKRVRNVADLNGGGAFSYFSGPTFYVTM